MASIAASALDNAIVEGNGSARLAGPQEKKESAELALSLAIHPENPKYFLFRGKPLVLVAATVALWVSLRLMG